MDLAALGDRAYRRGRLSVTARLRRLRSKAWMIGQCAISAGVAWVLARELLHHPTPFFAPVAAFLCLGTSYGQRLRRVGEVTVGVAVGVAVADVFVSAFGRGPWQIVFVVALAMTAATLLDAGQLFVSQAAVQAIVVTTLLPLGEGPGRVLDAVVGGLVALVAATVVPGAPLRRPREEAARVTRELSRILREGRRNADDIDEAAASHTLDRARETETALNDLRAAADEGLEVVRTSPFRRRAAPHVRSIAEVVDPLDRALRNTRVLIRRILVSARLDETMPPDYLELLDAIADASDGIAAEFAADRSPEAVQPRLVAIARRTADASEPLTLSAAVVLGQMRSLVVDLLQLSGLDYAAAIALVPPR